MALTGRETNDEVMSQINITPLTDCMMVLFMVASTALSQTGFNIKLPGASTQDESPSTQIVISVTRSGNYYVGLLPVEPENLQGYLRKLAQSRNTARVTIQGDQDVSYSRIITAMDCSKKAGLTSIALSTRLKQDP